MKKTLLSLLVFLIGTTISSAQIAPQRRILGVNLNYINSDFGSSKNVNNGVTSTDNTGSLLRLGMDILYGRINSKNALLYGGLSFDITNSFSRNIPTNVQSSQFRYAILPMIGSMKYIPISKNFDYTPSIQFKVGFARARQIDAYSLNATIIKEYFANLQMYPLAIAYSIGRQSNVLFRISEFSMGYSHQTSTIENTSNGNKGISNSFPISGLNTSVSVGIQKIF
ncbi:MAG: hypothetical protein IM587_13595 [Chitinophagaceae bacterium]|nr:hypothetical protein [Chitinophagaceae bacterium]